MWHSHRPMSTVQAHRVAALERQLAHAACMAVHQNRVLVTLRDERDAAIRCRELAEDLVEHLYALLPIAAEPNPQGDER